MNFPTVLIIENDPVYLRKYQKMFLKRGYYVYATVDPVEAVFHLNQRAFDIVICNILLGNVRGVDLLRDNHDHLATVGTHIIVASGYEHFRAVCNDLHVEFYISKPVSTHELGAVAEHLLRTNVAEFTHLQHLIAAAV